MSALSTTAEQTLLGNLLCFPNAIPLAGSLSATDFCDEGHRKIFSAILQHHAEGLPVEVPALASTLKNSTLTKYLLHLSDSAIAASTTPHYVGEVLKASRERQTAALGAELRHHPERAAEIVEKIQALQAEESKHAEKLFESAESVFEEPVRVDYLVNGLLESRTLSAVVGPSGSGKSFATIDLACCVATGRPWNGRATKQGAVLYLAGEGRTGVKRRIRAWAEHYSVGPSELGHLYLSKHTLLMDGSNTGQIVAEMKGIDVVLLAIDTLSRHIDGDENGTVDMTAFVGHVDRLKDQLGAAGLVVHHTGHQNQDRARGNTAFKAALDIEILCNKGTLTFSKMKDAETPAPMEFKLRPVQIGTNETGEPITSAVVEWGERSERHKAEAELLTHFETMMLEALQRVIEGGRAIDSQGKVCVSQNTLRNEFYTLRQAEDGGVTLDALKKSFKRTRETLSEKGLIREEATMVFPGHKGTRDIWGTTRGHVPANQGDKGDTPL